jgi:hypothetical protein
VAALAVESVKTNAATITAAIAAHFVMRLMIVSSWVIGSLQLFFRFRFPLLKRPIRSRLARSSRESFLIENDASRTMSFWRRPREMGFGIVRVFGYLSAGKMRRCFFEGGTMQPARQIHDAR